MTNETKLLGFTPAGPGAVEERWQHVPTRVEIARLEGDIKALQLQMQNQDETLLGIRAQLTRIVSYLLDSAGRRNSSM